MGGGGKGSLPVNDGDKGDGRTGGVAIHIDGPFQSCPRARLMFRDCGYHPVANSLTEQSVRIAYETAKAFRPVRCVPFVKVQEIRPDEISYR